MIEVKYDRAYLSFVIHCFFFHLFIVLFLLIFLLVIVLKGFGSSFLHDYEAYKNPNHTHAHKEEGRVLVTLDEIIVIGGILLDYVT